MIDQIHAISFPKVVPGETATQGMGQTTSRDLRMPIGRLQGAAGEPSPNNLRNVLLRNRMSRDQSTASPIGLLQ